MKRYLVCAAIGFAYFIWPLDVLPDPIYIDNLAVNVIALIIALKGK
jgi:uncharacterized membrane protein YkvA (DUF1232 family)